MLKKFDMDDGTIVLNTNHILWAAPVADAEGKMLLTIDHLDHDGRRMSIVVLGNLDDLI